MPEAWAYAIRVDSGGFGEIQGEFFAPDAQHAWRAVQAIMDRWVEMRDLMGDFGSGLVRLRVEAVCRGKTAFERAEHYWVGARHEELLRQGGAPPGCRHDWGPVPPMTERRGCWQVLTSRCAGCGLVRQEYHPFGGGPAANVCYEMPLAQWRRGGDPG